MIYDLVIKNGSVITFQSKADLQQQNIGIVDGVICALSNEVMFGKVVLDAAGKIVAPGFIDFHSHVDGNEFSAERVLLQGATTTLGGERSFNGKTIRKIYDNGFLLNQGFFVSHSFTLRRAVGIKSPYQSASKEEIAGMLMLAEKFLESGCFGIHFGLEFVPGTSQEEIIALAQLATKHHRIVTVHLRKDGLEALDSLDEIIRITHQTGASVHILHLMYMVGFQGVMVQALQKLRQARSQGLDITADTGLYAAFPSCIGSSILDRDWEKHFGKAISEKDLMISSGIQAGQFCNPETFEYLRENFPHTLITAFVCDEAEITKALQEDYVFVSTNAADGPHYDIVGHPETAGTFPRLIACYVREHPLLSLEKALQKITLLPAQRFGLPRKGILQEGYDADIVIFDYDKIQDQADYVSRGNPNAPPLGIAHVIINGKVVVQNGSITENRNAGRMTEHFSVGATSNVF